MNPAGAATCSNCGTRLTTTSATPSDRTTPADTPENITPFTPPEQAQDAAEDASAPPAPAPNARRSYSRSSSEWLRRVQKTPPPEATDSSAAAAAGAAASAAPVPAANVTAPGTAPTLVPAEPDDIPDWLREIQNEANRQAAAEKTASERVASAADETASESHLAAAAGIAAADQLSEHAPTDTFAFSPVISSETAAPAKPQLSEIKLTSDDYDYSDIGGEVTPEMQAALAAHADKLQSVDDETALARKLLGLDVEETVAVAPEPETPNLAPLAAGVVAAQVLSKDEPPVLAPDAATVDAQAERATELSVAIVEPTNAQTQEGDQSPAWVAAAVAASSAAVVAAVVSDKDDDKGGATAELSPEDSGANVPPALAVSATVAALDVVQEDGPAAPPPLESGEMPDWVREMAPEEIPGVKPLEAEKEDALPGWVQELAPEAAALGTVAYLSQLPELDEGERADLPDWLQESVPSTPESVAPTATADAAVTEAEGLAQESPLELPSWFSDPAVTTLARDPFEVVEMTGPLAGISGILPLALAITEPHRLTTPIPARSDGGRIFQTLLAEPLAAAAPVEPEAARKKLFTTNHLLYLVILVAAIVPLFFGLEQAGLGLNATTSGTALFYDQLQSIPPNRAALLAFEYDPGASVELDPAARAIVNDLAAKGVPVIAVTSNPNGATFAQTILERARETHPAFSFVNIGYIPGNEAGLRALASGWLPAGREDVNGAAWGSNPLAGQVRNMDDLALTVLLVGQDAPLRTWMEQVQPRVTSPMIAATSAMLEPQARNYVNANQLKASLRGLTGAAELELLSNQTGPAVKTMDAFSIVSLVLAGIIIVANVMLLVRRKK